MYKHHPDFGLNFCHSLGDCGSSKLYMSVAVCVCSAFTAYILVTIGRILMKLGGNERRFDYFTISLYRMGHKKRKKKTQHKGLFITLVVSNQFTSGLLHFVADNTKFHTVSSDFLSRKNFFRNLRKQEGNAQMSHKKL